MSELQDIGEQIASAVKAEIASLTPAAPAPAPVPASAVPAIPLHAPAPKGFLGGLVAFADYGWKAAGSWVCVGVLAVGGMVMPVAHIFHPHIEAMDWHGLSLFAGLLLGLRVTHAVTDILGGA